MRILHTSDWHLGHRLYDHGRLDEHQAFLDWLLETIQDERVDLLLVAGDLFDTALPSAAATDLYYRFLHRLYRETETVAVIIAGNHDSGVRLAASREFLRLARIHVFGRLPASLEDCVIVHHSVAVAAIPYLPEGELLAHVSLETEVATAQRYREAMRQIFCRCLEAMPSDAFKILMGHLFVQGGSRSDSERPMQVGGSLPLMPSDFPESVDYVALGHLHRPQQVGEGMPAVRFSGSPLPMSFREADHPKQVVLCDTTSRTIQPISVPCFRPLTRVQGTYEEVLDLAHSDRWDGQLIEVQVRLTEVVAGAADTIRSAFAERGGEVLIVDAQRPSGEEEVPVRAEELTTRSPEEIFTAYYAHHFPEGRDLPELLGTFRELVRLTQEEGEDAS